MPTTAVPSSIVPASGPSLVPSLDNTSKALRTYLTTLHERARYHETRIDEARTAQRHNDLVLHTFFAERMRTIITELEEFAKVK